MDMSACVRDHPWFQGAEGQCACGTQYSDQFRFQKRPFRCLRKQ